MLSHERTIIFLRWALGATFLWFGVLKLFNASPVLEIIKNALPPVLGESQLFMLALSFAEIMIGVAFLANRLVKVAAIVMIIHLTIATIAVLFTQGFEPRFPVLSLAGEFVVKNLVLIAAGLILLPEKSAQSSKE
jgi:uncharacterized membrane protein YkgB